MPDPRSQVTKSICPGESVYGEKKISVENDGVKTEYRVWNPFRSKVCAGILGGVENIHIAPGMKVWACSTSPPRRWLTLSPARSL